MLTKNKGAKKFVQVIIKSPRFVLIFSAIFFVLLSVACLSTSSTNYSSSNNDTDNLPALGTPVIFDGIGRTATSQMSLPSPISKVTFTHNGSSNFIVYAYYGDEENLLVNEIGHYKGTTLLMTDEKVVFDIKADGSWTGKIEGVGKSSTPSFSGVGDGVSGFFTHPSQGAWEISHNGESNFIVWAHCIGGSDLIVNEIGAFSGSTIINFDSGSCLWEVKADGNWSIKPR